MAFTNEEADRIAERLEKDGGVLVVPPEVWQAMQRRRKASVAAEVEAYRASSPHGATSDATSPPPADDAASRR